MPIHSEPQNPEWPFFYDYHHGEIPSFVPHRHMPLHSSIGMGPEVSRIIDQSVKDWLDNHKGDLNTEIIASLVSFYKKSEASYITDGRTQLIKIPIEGYRYSDILFVDINGLDLIRDEDYVIQKDYIRLTTPIETPGQKVHFVSLRLTRIKSEDYELLKGERGEDGEKGEKGDTFTYDDLTEEQKQDIRSKLNSFYQKSEASFVTTGMTTEITIPIEDYRPIDILFVDVNGLDLINDVDYSINNNKIILSTPIANAGSVVHFTSLRAVEIDSYGYEMLKGERGEKGEKGDPGTINYEDLENKPSINSVKLDGDLSLEDIGIRTINNDEIDDIVSG